MQPSCPHRDLRSRRRRTPPWISDPCRFSAFDDRLIFASLMRTRRCLTFYFYISLTVRVNIYVNYFHFPSLSCLSLSFKHFFFLLGFLTVGLSCLRFGLPCTAMGTPLTAVCPRFHFRPQPGFRHLAPTLLPVPDLASLLFLRALTSCLTWTALRNSVQYPVQDTAVSLF